MNWQIKITAKLILARLPICYDFWKKVGLFKHGSMESPDYIYKIFWMHLNRAFPEGLPPGSVVLEMGSGDSVASCLLSKSLGASSYHIDVGAFATRDIESYKRIATDFVAKQNNIPDLSSASTLEELLEICDAKYMTEGLSSLKTIPSNSVDFIWSHSVLEHVRKHEVEATLNELNRILKPSGYRSHNIDFQDHLDKSLNNLRFSDSFWESEIVANSGFYTNRIPAIEMHKMFRTAGFEVVKEEFGQWSTLPISRRLIHKDFSRFKDAELSYCTSHILVKSPRLKSKVES
ncbi:methyltransferase domain-containing protein [Vibrio europaeus]|uniref:methyltransferase domain-containing protein n=1 Tax=Vibrio europaeus TaxID=300876 RepID=UPI00234155F1|nr:methyltransferase domain-containing protein [Vibrio europaeus]MDC5850451.1 methyltransferase domain-containing protein [Vibrio europaeus]